MVFVPPRMYSEHTTWFICYFLCGAYFLVRLIEFRKGVYLLPDTYTFPGINVANTCKQHTQKHT